MNHFTTTMLVCGIMLAALPTARAADTTCPPNLANTTVNGNLIVPAGQHCLVIGVTVTGNAQVQTNATLTFGAPSPTSTIVGNVSVGTGAMVEAPVGGLTIDGNFVANQCSSVGLNEGVAVGGNFQIQYCTGIVSLGGDDIGGNVACNNSSTCSVSSNKVNGNVEVNDNSSAEVTNNTIGNNLKCQGNTNITDGGVPNRVGGNKAGQCAGF
jgi:hypothetical protein